MLELESFIPDRSNAKLRQRMRLRMVIHVVQGQESG